MQQNETITVYPYSSDFAAIMRYLTQSENQKYTYKLVSPHGFRLAGRDAGDADNCGKIGLTITEDINQALSESSVLMIADGKFGDKLRGKSIDWVKTAMTQGKNIIFLLKISEDEKKILEECALKNEVSIQFYSNEQKVSLNVSKNMLYKQQSTVIGVGQIFPEIDSTNAVLSLKNFLEKNGYQVNMILDKHYAELLGGHPLPDYIGGGRNIDEQVVQLNHYIEALEKNHRSDIILIQYPGGMQQLDGEVYSDLGVRFFVASQAVISDFFFCCFPFLPYFSDYLDKISTAFTYKYGMPIHTAFMSNIGIDISRSHEENLISCFSVAQEKVDKLITEISHPLQPIPWMPLDSEQSLSQAFEHMMDVLTSYSTVIPI